MKSLEQAFKRFQSSDTMIHDFKRLTGLPDHFNYYRFTKWDKTKYNSEIPLEYYPNFTLCFHQYADVVFQIRTYQEAMRQGKVMYVGFKFIQIFYLVEALK